MIAPTPIDEGKYTFSIPEGDYRIHVLRHGEPWLVIEQGSKAIASMLSELVDSRELIAELLSWEASGQTGLDTLKAKRTDESLLSAVAKFRSVRGLNYSSQDDAMKAKIAAVLHEYDERVSRAFGVLKTCHREGLLNLLVEAVRA